jgi:hypothetical protein
MQEHLSTSSSQLAIHASEFKLHAKREAQPHLKAEMNVIKWFRLLSQESVPLCRRRVDRHLMCVMAKI